MRRCFSVWPVWLVSCFFFFSAFFARAQDFQGRTVVSVSYEPADQPLDPRDLAVMQLLHPGQPLDETQVAGTIDRLWASGLYDDIQVDAEPSGNGVAIRFITKARLFVGHVAAEGKIKSPPTRAVLISDSQLNLGAAIDSDTLTTAQKTLQQELHNNGLYEAQVGVATIEDPVTHQVTIRLLVQSGKRARYEQPAINGDTKLSDETIIRATGWRVPLIHRWRQVTASLTDKGSEGIRKKYSKKNRLTATVDMKSLDYNTTTGRAKATFDINAGPIVQIRALEAKVSKGKLREFVPVYEEGSVDNDLLTEGARNLHDYFQSRGYPDVDVTFKTEAVNPQTETEVINYYIATGPRRKLVAVNIAGNNYFLPETLRERIFLHPASLLMRYGRYSETFRQKDEQAISDLYKSNGFKDVKVTSTVDTNYKGKADDIAVTFHIAEGKQWTVASLKIEGAVQLDLSSLHNDLTSAVGQPFADVNVATDRNLILNRYFSEGFPAASFSYVQTPGSEPDTMNLVYRIHEGPREFVRKAIISGLYRTKPSLVLKRITLQDGEPISMTKVNAISQQLSDLGIFASVNAALQDPDGTNRYKYVLYDFDEAARWTFNFGFGLEVSQFGHTTQNLAAAGGTKGVSPLISADISRLNMFGIGQTLSFQARYSTIEQRESINYTVPRFLGSPNRTLAFSILYDTTQDVQSFAVRREEGAVQVSQRFNRASTLMTRFVYRRDAPNTTLPALNTPAFTGAVRIGELSASYIQDHRDNPADAHHGFWNTLDTGIAGGFFGSQRNFYRFLARNATYTSIGTKFVLARQTQIGGLIPFSIPKGLNTYDVIPLPERMFGGGSVSMRGFGDNQAGPRDIGTATEISGQQIAAPTGFPIGGDALFFNTVELRFPLLFPNLTGVVFHDMGNIYTTFSDISLAYHQPNTQPSYQNFNYAVQAPGFGLRYKTPVGPVRVDFAYTLNPTTYQGFNRNESIQQIVACPGGVTNNPSSPCYVSPQKLSRFQFFFSIGQAF